MMNLKPSFARKLDKSGCSPLHLAVEKNNTDFVSTMLGLDHGLVSVKGKNGITPFLALVSKGNVDLVVECLRRYPECIQDVSVKGQNALHLAVTNDRFEVLQVLTGWIQRKVQRNSIETRILNKKDLSCDTALHLAAYKKDLKAVQLLLECRLVKRNKVNGDGLTTLDILRAAGGMCLDLEHNLVKSGCKEAASMPKSKKRSDFLKSPLTFWTYCSTVMTRLRSNISNESRGVFLIVCTLIITATYQTALQPPGGVHQSNDENAGSVVMNQTFFILVFVTNTIGFSCALFYTFCLLPPQSLFTLIWFSWIGTSLCVSYALSMAVISPHPMVFLSATMAFFLLFPLFLLWEFFFKRWHKTHRKVRVVSEQTEPRFSCFDCCVILCCFDCCYNTITASYP
ncbi:LOW QUALITY PROTEIN: ankyrin repeat-containing protein BDA1 [Eutrema salsugineum]|uniref:LOW QUALITY PROTEIN: ankyrin repeat-containing protein BDA1 n=1 Tax=Eutrema salsugineum TaxID=72664 RepID=UPI000CED08CC|nr:LOW QUALITY PROTEIN: ankyrin repeat-containing protein BDA1 [Eutrema salsugineum]